MRPTSSATPKDEIDKNTYGLFELETGVPTDAYDLDQAVADKHLVPPVPISVPLKFQREGIKYNDLSDEDKAQWDELEWNEEGTAPDEVSAEELNKWLFNIDTVDKVLEVLMTSGQKVAGGDRLGKTIIFAKNNDHAEFIEKRFNANYPEHKGHFARVVTYKTEYAQNLIDDFSKKEKAPHIAISVDMLDTGIDVPEVVRGDGWTWQRPSPCADRTASEARRPEAGSRAGGVSRAERGNDGSPTGAKPRRGFDALRARQRDRPSPRWPGTPSLQGSMSTKRTTPHTSGSGFCCGCGFLADPAQPVRRSLGVPSLARRG